jgi:hypothetical protein
MVQLQVVHKVIQELKVLKELQVIVEEHHGHSILLPVIQTPVQGILGLTMLHSVVFQKYL